MHPILGSYGFCSSTKGEEREQRWAAPYGLLEQRSPVVGGEYNAYLITKTLCLPVHRECENSSSHSAFSQTEAVFWVTGFDKVKICLVNLTDLNDLEQGEQKQSLSEEGYPEHQKELIFMNAVVKVANTTPKCAACYLNLIASSCSAFLICGQFGKIHRCFLWPLCVHTHDKHFPCHLRCHMDSTDMFVHFFFSKCWRNSGSERQ